MSGSILAGNLQPTAVHKVEDDAVRKLLDLHLRGIGRLEVAHVVALDSARLKMFVLALNGKRHSGCPLNGTQDQKSLAVEANGPTLPQEIVRELYVDVAHV